MAAHVTLWIVTMETSNQLLGNTGVSIMNIRIKETAVPAVRSQNKVSNGCSLMYGFLFTTSTTSAKNIPLETDAV